MSFDKIFESTNKVNFSKDEVIEYLKIQEKSYNERIESFKKNIFDLKKDLNEKNLEINKISRMRDHIFEELEKRQDELNNILKAHSHQLLEFKHEISNLEENIKNLEKDSKVYKLKSKRYDNIEKSLCLIHKKAEMQAQKLIEEAKAESMESIYTIDDIIDIIRTFENDITNISDELSIGTKSLDDILVTVKYKTTNFKDKLTIIKISFYDKNNIPL